VASAGPETTCTPSPTRCDPLGLDGSTPPDFLASPAQIGVTPDGDRLVVSTKTHGTVDVFAIGAMEGHPRHPR
jgi:hypothetical protein